MVASARGGSAISILLYEAALGLGLSIGPLLGAALGSHSWRYPFYGTATLMAIGFLAVAFFLEPVAVTRKRTTLKDPLLALTDKGLFGVAVSAFFYNYGFFTVLAFVPFVLHMSARATGLIFFGWGVLLAIFSVFVAPRLQRHFPETRLLHASLFAFALLLLVMAMGSSSATIAAVVFSGALMGINNTVFTEMALEISSYPRPVASAAYNFIRWMAGVVAPFAAPKMAEWNLSLPFLVAAATACLSIAVLYFRRAHLGRFAVSKKEIAGESTSHDGPVPAPLLVAIDGSDSDRFVLERAAAEVKEKGGRVEVVHVHAYEVFDEFSASAESSTDGERLLEAALSALKEKEIQARGCCLTVVGTLIAETIIEHGKSIGADRILLGRRHDENGNTLLHGSVAERAIKLSPENVELVELAQPAA
ncbi:MAG TPA: MFS transporter [Desulfuromonadales bacterium]|nr:MFS transporter [Desulfuromonadales bacterium]